MKKIQSIQALRVFAMFSVVLCHMSFIRSGAFGVEIFFVISGFLMMYSTENGLHKYWSKKIARIVPFYWIMTFLTAIAVYVMPDLFNSYEVSWSYLLKSLFFIPYEHSRIAQPVLGLGYTLNYEMLFYLLFYLSTKIAEKFGGGGVRGIICSVWILFLVALEPLKLPMPFCFWCNTLMLEFMFGIVLYYLFRITNMDMHLQKTSKMRDAVSGIFTAGIMVWLWVVVPTSQGVERLIVWGIPTALLFLTVYIWGYEKEIPRFILFLAGISYYIYLIHPYCVRLTERVIGRVIGAGMAAHVLMAVVGLMSSILCGYLAYYIYSIAEGQIRKYMCALQKI